ncbi:hypothetical protein Tco_1408613 [Tanacetum coccineum]
MNLASSAEKPSKTFDELMSTPIDFSAFIMNVLKINNLTQETLLGHAFRLLKGTRSNYAGLEYDFEECYKALSEKLDWENPEGGDYPFDLTKPLPLVISRNHQQKVPVLTSSTTILSSLQEVFLTITAQIFSLQKTKVAQYDLPGIEDMVPNIWVPVKVAYDKHALWGILHWREQPKPLWTLTGLQTSLDDITKSIRMEYLPKRRWSTLEKKRANIMIKAIDKEVERKKVMSSLKKMASAPANPCQGDSSEFYLITDFLTVVAVSRCQVEADTTCSYSTNIYKDIMKAQLKNIKKDGYTRFQHQEQYEHVGPKVTRSQEGKRSQDDDKRLCLVDDLKEVLNHIHIKSKIQVKS